MRNCFHRRAQGSILIRSEMEIDPTLGGAAPGHAVHFYQSDTVLSETVARFLAAGWQTGQPLVVVATRQHREAIADSLSSLGCDCGGAEGNSRFTFFDASETLATFMAGKMPDETLFRLKAKQIFERSRHARERRRVLFYGEMVDVLWRDGKPDAAIRLEEIWNELAGAHSFSLLCGYASDHFSGAPDPDRFDILCRLHDHVITGGAFAPAPREDERLRGRLEGRGRALGPERTD